MAKTKGSHLKHKEVTSSILEFILKNNGPVSEPVIRDHLKKKHEVMDQSTINKHMHNLQDLICIELIPPKIGLRNYWNITTLKNLKNIRFYFEDIKLNTCGKSLDILLTERLLTERPLKNSMRAKKYFVQLFLSASFFDMCIKTDVETLYARASELYKLGELFKEEQYIKNLIAVEQSSKELIHEVYIKCIRRISKIHNIKQIVDSGYPKDPLTLDLFQNFSEYFSSVGISKETFERMLKEIPSSMEDKSHEEQTNRIIKELSIKISNEIIPKMMKQIHKKSPEMPNEELNKMPQNILNKTSEEIFKKIMEGLPEILSDKIIRIKYYHEINTGVTSDLIFNHCFQRDVMDGASSPEEREFVHKINELISIHKEKDPTTGLKELDKLYSDYFEKFQEKIISP
jgi:hypothetical protein